MMSDKISRIFTMRNLTEYRDSLPQGVLQNIENIHGEKPDTIPQYEAHLETSDKMSRLKTTHKDGLTIYQDNSS
jgi:hypothetical protein